jgi:hypothetical protein
VIVPEIAPVDAPLQVIVAVCETFEIDSEATLVIVIVFETTVFPHKSTTVNTYPGAFAEVKLVGAFDGDAA